MKANGCSGSRRFSARLKCTRPTRFQAGFIAVRKRCRPVPAGERGSKRLRHLVPQRQQHICGQILGPRHHRRGQHQRGKVPSHPAPERLAARRRPRGPRRVQTERADVAGRECAPPDEHRRQGLPDFPGAQPHQPVAAALGERLGQTDRTAASISGASSWSSATRCPCGVSRNPIGAWRDGRTVSRYPESRWPRRALDVVVLGGFIWLPGRVNAMFDRLTAIWRSVGRNSEAHSALGVDHRPAADPPWMKQRRLPGVGKALPRPLREGVGGRGTRRFDPSPQPPPSRGGGGFCFLLVAECASLVRPTLERQFAWPGHTSAQARNHDSGTASRWPRACLATRRARSGAPQQSGRPGASGITEQARRLRPSSNHIPIS